MNFRKTATAAALVAALGASGSASAINIDGITFGAGAVFERVEVFESERFGDGQGNDNALIDGVGEELIGIGRVLTIRAPISAGGQQYWQNGDNGRELTVYFYQYFAESITPTASGNDILFSGGRIDVYSDTNMDFNAGIAAGDQASGIANATNGNLWLSLEASPIGGNGANTGNPNTLLAQVFGSVSAAPVFVTGGGLLDVVGGLAAEYFDTNTFGCVAADGANCPDDADKTFTSSGQTTPVTTGDTWGFEGTVDLQDYAVPVPGTLALRGLGLAGLGLRVRRKA